MFRTTAVERWPSPFLSELAGPLRAAPISRFSILSFPKKKKNFLICSPRCLTGRDLTSARAAFRSMSRDARVASPADASAHPHFHFDRSSFELSARKFVDLHTRVPRAHRGIVHAKYVRRTCRRPPTLSRGMKSIRILTRVLANRRAIAVER